MKNNTILKTERLHAHYILDVYGKAKVIKAVNDVDLAIQENEIYGIAGESGCGKSTLLKALAAAVEPPLRIISGRVTYRIAGAEVDVSTLTQEEKRRLRMEYIAYVPQGSMSVLNPVARIRDTYRDFIESHIGAHQKAEAYELAKEHLSELGLPLKILDAYPHQLSGGMRQRVTIALATLLKPRIIIGDEPTTALDVVVQRGVVQLLKMCSASSRTRSFSSRMIWVCTPTSPTASASCTPARSWKRRRPRRFSARRRTHIHST